MCSGKWKSMCLQLTLHAFSLAPFKPSACRQITPQFFVSVGNFKLSLLNLGMTGRYVLPLAEYELNYIGRFHTAVKGPCQAGQ